MATTRRADLEVRITTDTSGVNKGVTDTKQSIGKLGAVAGAAGAIAAKGLDLLSEAASKAVDFLKDSVRAASDLEQAMGGVESVFRSQADAVKRFSQSSAKDLGLSQEAYLRMAAQIGAQLKGLGVPLKDVAGLTNKLEQRAADMAATFGGTTSDALSAIAALLRGERDPIERYGVSLKQANIDAKVAAKGLGKLTVEAKQQAEAQAALSILFEKTADTAGQFARENDTLAGRTQIAAAQMENLKASIGQKLMPIVLALWDFVQLRLIPALGSLWAWLKEKLGPVFERWADILQTLILPALDTLWKFIRDKVLPVLSDLWHWVDDKVNKVFGDWATLLTVSISPALGGLAAVSNDKASPALASLWDWATKVAIVLKDVAVAIWDRLWPILEPFAALWWKVIQAVAELWSWLAGRLAPIFEHVWHVIADQLWPNIVKLWDAIANLLVPIFRVWWAIMDGAILPLIRWIADAIAGPLKGAVDVLTPVLKFLIDQGLQGMVTTFDAILKVINLVVGTLTWLTNETRKAFEQIGGYFGGALDTIKQIVDWISKIHWPSPPSWLSKIPGFAGGVTNFGGGLAVVGERGPELVALPRGSSVFPNQRSRQMAAAGAAGGPINLSLSLTLGGDEIRRTIRLELDDADAHLIRALRARP